jgi:hypothetical protein
MTRTVVLPSSQIAALKRAMLPLDGTIADYVPAIVAAYARIVPPAAWASRSFVDLTAGSCLMPLMFAAAGMGRVVVNDLAARSQLAAEALFSGRPLRWSQVSTLLATSVQRRITPSFHFACDYLTADVADIFDRLYHGDVPAPDRPLYQYLALRWVQGFALSDDEDFEILLTHDRNQLRKDLENDWRPYLRRAANARSVLRQLVRDINAGIALVRTRRIERRGGDMLAVCGDIAYGERPFVAINPPTRGLDEYVIDDQLIHSLLANRWLPLSRCPESDATFWRRRVGAALRALPRGAHALSWGGDGALRWSECLRFWSRFATPIATGRAERGRLAAGWVILEKR